MTEKKGLPGWMIVLLAVAGTVLLVVVVAIPLAIFGLRKYLINAKSAEGRANVVQLAQGVVRCAESSGHLPSTSAAVPPALASVQGIKYQAAAAEWADPTLSCAGFSMSTPQYFQYQWSLKSSGSGVANARADLDGDGVPELVFTAEVSCTGGHCEVSATRL